MDSHLIAIGYWESVDNPEFVHPKKLVSSYEDPNEKESLVAYLDAGKRISSWLGCSYCRFGCGEDEANMGDSDLSDGRWVWPQGLSHCVSAHNVVLPAQFVDHARSHDWAIPPSLILPEHESLPGGSGTTPFDYSFWTSLYPKSIFSRVAGKIRQKSSQRH